MRIPVSETIKLLKHGTVVAIPTETVYGLAASLENPHAIQQIFHIKGRPANNPLIIHLSHVEQVTSYATHLPPYFRELVHAFWPGAMTLVIPIHSENVPSLVRAGLPTAAFRIPNHPLALEVITHTGPLVMPSANLSGKPSSTDPEHIETDFGHQFPILDGGKCSQGVESTILFYRNDIWEIIRLGAIAAEAFQTILGYTPQISENIDKSKPLCPGQMYRHYAPKATLKLAKSIPSQYTGTVIGFCERVYPKNSQVLYLGSLQQPEQAANRLYALLRQLDAEEIVSAYVDIDFPQEGLWITLLERLIKAAQGNLKDESYSQHSITTKITSRFKKRTQ